MNQNQIISSPRREAAFTLIELLVVIAIIGILAGLIVGGAGVAIRSSRKAGVEAQRDALITAIESYHNDKGYYPPDNTSISYSNLSYQTTLFYELTGSYPTNNNSFFATATGETIASGKLSTYFGVQGFLNSSADPATVKDYYRGLKSTQHELVDAPDKAFSYHILGINVPGPNNLSAAQSLGSGFLINPWNYISSHPTNNTGSFDLWMDVLWSGKTNRVNNWSKDPQIL